MLCIRDIELMAKTQGFRAEVKAIFMTAFDTDYVKYDLDKYNYRAAKIF